MMFSKLKRLPSVAISFALMAMLLIGITLFGAAALPVENQTSDEETYVLGAHNLLNGGYANPADQKEGHYLWHVRDSRSCSCRSWPSAPQSVLAQSSESGAVRESS